MQLTKQNLRFHWNLEAQDAFETLKRLFTSAPILSHPDPSLPYTIEVDASEVEVGAVISQRQGSKDQMHPVGFFSRKHSPAERNYDVGDWELLAIKVALEEWRYLWEGAFHPVLIHTDHKNLEYLRSTRRLKPRQARWALFFSRFCFHITYQPGSNNIKPDELSRMYDNPKDLSVPDTILPTGIFLLLQTDLLSQIKEASTDSSKPPGIALTSIMEGEPNLCSRRHPSRSIKIASVQFTSRFWRALCEILKIELALSSAYHPQTNGQTERTNQTLAQYIRCFTSFVQDD